MDLYTQWKRNIGGKGTEKQKKQSKTASRVGQRQKRQTLRMENLGGKVQKSAVQLGAKLTVSVSVSLSSIRAGSKAKQVCFHGGGRGQGGPRQPQATATAAATQGQGLYSCVKVTERGWRLPMHAGQWVQARLPRDCRLGAGPGERLAAVNTAQSPSPRTGRGRRVLQEMEERSRLCARPHRRGQYLFCMTDTHKTIPNSTEL